MRKEHYPSISAAEQRISLALQRFEAVMRKSGVVEKKPVMPKLSDLYSGIGEGVVNVPTTLSRSVTGPSDIGMEKKGSVCPCRAAAGHTEGWCGVAGGGVPACDH